MALSQRRLLLFAAALTKPWQEIAQDATDEKEEVVLFQDRSGCCNWDFRHVQAHAFFLFICHLLPALDLASGARGAGRAAINCLRGC